MHAGRGGAPRAGVVDGRLRRGPIRRAPNTVSSGRVRAGSPIWTVDASNRRARPAARQLAPALVPEDAPIDPRSTYAATKAAQEHLASAWARQTGGDVWALRYHNVYGPRMPRDTPYAGVASLFRSALQRGEAPTVLEDGKQRRDFVHVTDIAAGERPRHRDDRPRRRTDARQHLLRRAPHGRRAGHRTGQGLRRPVATRRGRRPSGRRPARGGRPRPRPPTSRLHGDRPRSPRESPAFATAHLRDPAALV